MKNNYFIEQAKEIERLKKRLKEETANNIPELYACFCKVLMENEGFTADKVADIFGQTQEVWTELANSDRMGMMVDWCEETTGVRLKSGETNEETEGEN